MPSGIPNSGKTKMYRTSFAVDAKHVSIVIDWLATITAFNVEWATAGGGRCRVTFMHYAPSLVSVITFANDDVRTHDMQGPTPAVEYDEEAAKDITKIIDLNGRTQLTTQDLREALIGAGRSPSSTPYLSKALRDAGLIDYEGGKTTLGRYVVLRKTKPKAKPAAKKKTAKKSGKAKSAKVKISE